MSFLNGPTYLLIIILSIIIISCTKETPAPVNPNISIVQNGQFRVIDVAEEYTQVNPGDNTPDSDGILLAIQENPGAILYFKCGEYILDTPIVYSPVNSINGPISYDSKPGLKIIGDGVNCTVFINKTDDYAFKILGIKDTLGNTYPEKFQTNGFFRDFSVQAPVSLSHNPKGGFMMFAAFGYMFENISIIGRGPSFPFKESAIYIPYIDNIYDELGFADLNSLKTAYSTDPTEIVNPDLYATISTSLTNVTIDYCDEYGIHGENGVGFNFNSINSRITRCKKAGIYTAGHNSIIQGGAFVSCGSGLSNTNSAGVIVDKLGNNTPNNLVIENVEFDGNTHKHIQIRALANGRIKNNRFIMNEVEFQGLYYPLQLSAISLGGYYFTDNKVRNNEISNNFFRYNRDTLTSNCFELHNRSQYSIIDNNSVQPLNANETSYYPDASKAIFDVRPGFSSYNNYVRHNGVVIIQ